MRCRLTKNVNVRENAAIFYANQMTNEVLQVGLFLTFLPQTTKPTLFGKNLKFSEKKYHLFRYFCSKLFL